MTKFVVETTDEATAQFIQFILKNSPGVEVSEAEQPTDPERGFDVNRQAQIAAGLRDVADELEAAL